LPFDVVRKHTVNFFLGVEKNRIQLSSVLMIECFFPLEHFLYWLNHKLNNMPGGFMRKESLKSIKLYEHPEVEDLFTRANWISFFDRIQGYDEEVTEEILMSLRPHLKTHATISFKGLTLELTPNLISRITSFPLGLPWRKEEKSLGQVSKKTFFCLRSIL